MQIRYRQLVGMEVVAPSGRRLGRVADLEATRVNDELRVVALLVGPAALFGRVWTHRIGGIRLHPKRVPWRDVATIDRRVHLCVERLTDEPAPAGRLGEAEHKWRA